MEELIANPVATPHVPDREKNLWRSTDLDVKPRCWLERKVLIGQSGTCLGFIAMNTWCHLCH